MAITVSMIRVVVAAALTLSLGALACGDSDDDPARARSQPVVPVTTADPAATFAPLVHLHSEERWFPTSATDFIDSSTLKWVTDDCVLDTVATGRIADKKTIGPVPRLDAAGLGMASTHRRSRSRCGEPARGAATYSTTQHTRPYDPDRRAPGLRLDEGFYLDLLTEKYGGQRRLERRDSQTFLTDVPAYYVRRPIELAGRPGVRLSYWLLFAHSSSREEHGGETGSSREGGWERVDVLLRTTGRPDTYVPVAARFRIGGKWRTVPWRKVERAAGGQATHPTAYSARESHVPYPRPGSHGRRVRVSSGQPVDAVDEAEACATCPLWETWRLLRDARAEPWWGYGGGWGLRFRVSDMSGPLGPSPFSP